MGGRCAQNLELALTTTGYIPNPNPPQWNYKNKKLFANQEFEILDCRLLEDSRVGIWEQFTGRAPTFKLKTSGLISVLLENDPMVQHSHLRGKKNPASQCHNQTCLSTTTKVQHQKNEPDNQN